MLIPLAVQGQGIHHDIDSTFRFEVKDLILPSSLLAGGTALALIGTDRGPNASVQNWWQSVNNTGRLRFDDYLQYAPIATNLCMELAGVEGVHPRGVRNVALLTGFTLLTLTTRIPKAIIKEMRPDGVDSHSFPSGHTATAFFGADMTRREYGWGWGGACYGVAGTVALARMYNNKHWLGDVLAGAGIGLICADMAYVLTPYLLEVPFIRRFADKMNGNVMVSESGVGVVLDF